MNFVLISLILFALFGVHSCVAPIDLQKSSTSLVSRSDDNVKPLPSENEKSDDHPGDHDQDEKAASSGSSVKARKGVVFNETEESNVKSTDVHISNDRASTTITKASEGVPKSTAEVSPPAKSASEDSGDNKKTDPDRTSSGSSKYYSKSTKTDTSSSRYNNENNSTSSKYSKSTYSKSSYSKSSNYSKSTMSGSTESSYTKSSSLYSSTSSIMKKPLITYSVEDDPTLLKIPITRQITLTLTPTDEKLDADNQANLPLSSDFDRMQSMEGKREMYIFPLVVLIFLVPMILGMGIIILRRVRDYWSTRHYRRMDFLVDGMYNT